MLPDRLAPGHADEVDRGGGSPLDPRRGTATFNGSPSSGLTWQVDGQEWSPSGLAKHIVEQATGRRVRVIGGPCWWVTPQGMTLRALALSLEGGPAALRRLAGDEQ